MYCLSDQGHHLLTRINFNSNMDEWWHTRYIWIGNCISHDMVDVVIYPYRDLSYSHANKMGPMQIESQQISGPCANTLNYYVI